MAVVLYQHPLSTDCYKVRLMLSFLDVAFEDRLVDAYPGSAHLEPAFRELNPLSTLPVLVDDGLCLRDAQAILCHLARSRDPGAVWLPADPARFAQVMVWLMFATRELAQVGALRMHELVASTPEPEGLRLGARRALRVLDDHLAARAIDDGVWIVGDTATIADVACFGDVALCQDARILHDEYPSLRRWMRAVRSLPRFSAMSGVPEFL